MKRLLGAIFGTLLMAILTGCSDKQPLYSDSAQSPNNPIQVEAWGSTGYVDVATIEGCQYIVSKNNYGHVVFAHKGNCNNPIHVYNIEKK